MNFVFFTMAALPFALMMNTIVNGVSRPMFAGCRTTSAASR